MALVKEVDRSGFDYLGTEPVPKLIRKLAVPTIVSMLVSALYNMADTYFVGKIDTQSTAAVGIVFSVMAVIQAIGFFFGQGSGNYISRSLGAQDHSEAQKMASTGFFCALVTGVLLAVLGLVFLRPLAVLLGSTPTIQPYTEKYLGIILLGTPFIIGSFVLNNQMRFQGNANYAMIGIVSGAVVNILLDPLLIFGCGMGISGAALATVLSQICSFGVLLLMDNRGKNIPVRFRYFRLTGALLKETVQGGIPSFFRQGLASAAVIFLNVAAGVYGDAAIAGMAIVGRLTIFVNSFLIGFGQGFQPVCGYNYGAGLYSRVRKGFWYCVKTGTIFLIVCAVLGIVFAPEIVSLFRKGDPGVIAVGVSALRWQFVSLPLGAWIVISNMMLQTIRKPVRASVLSSARQGLFFIPLILVLPHYLGLKGVEMSQAIADALSFLLAIPLTYGVLAGLREDRRR